jgi:hypothetical protein
VNLLFVLPSVGYGIYLFLTTGSPILLIMSALTVAVWSVVSSQREHDLKGQVSVRAGRVYLGDRRLSLFPWLWGKQVRNLVYESIARSRLEAQSDLAIEPGALLDLDSRELFRPKLDERDPHLLIIGRSGSGKTQLLRWLLQSAPEFRVIDYKGGVDFRDLDRNLLFTQDDQIMATEWLQGLLHAREQGLHEAPIWIVVDELGELLRVGKLGGVLESIAAKGRGIGVHLVLVNQTMTAIPRTIWANCANRIVLQADPVDRVQLGFSPSGPNHVPGVIRGEYRGARNCGFEFPAPTASSKPLEAVVEELTPFDQIPQDRRSVGEQAGPLHPHDHLLGRRVQPYTWPD